MRLMLPLTFDYYQLRPLSFSHEKAAHTVKSKSRFFFISVLYDI
jgi:hypothetical protein